MIAACWSGETILTAPPLQLEREVARTARSKLAGSWRYFMEKWVGSKGEEVAAARRREIQI
ncbi:MAG: hypothetical protein ACI8Q9_000330 [Planctomycetota bacterium]